MSVENKFLIQNSFISVNLVYVGLIYPNSNQLNSPPPLPLMMHIVHYALQLASSDRNKPLISLQEH